MNKQQIIGNLGKDPEERTFNDGQKGAKFTVAVNKNGYTTSSGVVVPDHTEWFNVSVRGKLADTALQYLHKGDKVFVEGETYTSERQDGNGNTRRFTEVKCSELELLQPKPANGQQTTDNRQPQQSFGQPQQGDLF